MEGLMQEQPLVLNKILDYAARYHGEQTVTSWSAEGGEVELSYRALHRRARLCSMALKNLGVKAGDRVATMAWNSSRHFESWYGIMGLGAVCHTLNPRLFQKDLQYIINHAGDTVIMADAMFAPLLQALLPHCPSVRSVVLLVARSSMPTDGLENALCYEELLEQDEGELDSFCWEVEDERTAAGLCYTSGTTGNPKGVLYSHRSQYLHALVSLQRDILSFGSASVALMVVPMFHANSWGLVFQAPMVGAKLVLPGPKLDGESVHRVLGEQRVDTVAAVPTVLLGLLQYMRVKQVAPPASLRLVVVGGAACPPTLIQEFEDGFGVEVLHMWGMTELSPIGSAGRPKGTLPRDMDKEQVQKLKFKQGRPHLFCAMRIVDDSGNELPWDGRSIGSFQVRGPTVLRQYYKAQGPATNEDGWFDTGDVGTMDQWGHMHIVDRSKDVIKSGGEWISSIEIENQAVGHPQVKEAAVIGMPDPKWGERPLLVVVPAAVAAQDGGGRQEAPPQLTRDAMLAFLEGKIAKWWMPNDVVFVDDIPHTATGKVSKMELRSRLAAAKAGGAADAVGVTTAAM